MTAVARVLADEVDVDHPERRLRAAEGEPVVERSPELFRRLSARLQAQFCAMHEHAVLLGRKSALERVASFIMQCVPGRGGYGCPGPSGDNSINVRLGMTRQEIADYLGLTIETVSRAF